MRRHGMEKYTHNLQSVYSHPNCSSLHELTSAEAIRSIKKRLDSQTDKLVSPLFGDINNLPKL